VSREEHHGLSDRTLVHPCDYLDELTPPLRSQALRVLGRVPGWQIGREPLKESVFGCLADSTSRLLQLREGMAEHTHADLDEVLYVVAGEGTVRVHGQSSTVTAGSLSIIPHGQPHAVERRGKNPLMVLSILSGAPCRTSQTATEPR
jgi:hypothetical protein